MPKPSLAKGRCPIRDIAELEKAHHPPFKHNLPVKDGEKKDACQV
jgi:hypothetical protein